MASGADRIGDRCRYVGIGRRQKSQAHAHRGRQCLILDRERMLVHALHDILGPGLDVESRAAFQQDQESVAAEAAAQIGGRSVCARSNSASCAMKSSIASTPMVFWISMKRFRFDVGELAHARPSY